MVTPVIVLDGGQVLLSGSAVADVLRALRLAQRVADRDGIRCSEGTLRLMGALDDASRRSPSAAGSTEVPLPTTLTSSWSEHDQIGTIEAAALLGITERAVRYLARNGTFATARRAQGRCWRIDRAEVLHRQEQRTRS